jgi:hypothetical protein
MMNRGSLSKEEILRLALLEAEFPSIAAGRRLLKPDSKAVFSEKKAPAKVTQKRSMAR